MDAGAVINKGSRFPLSDRSFPRKNNCQNLDRFIPNRSAMDFDFAHFMLTGGRVEKEKPASSCSPSKEAYRKQLADIFNMNRTRILAFKNKPPPPPLDATVSESISSAPHSRRTKHSRCISQASEKTYDAPKLMDDFYLNLLDWGSGNILAIALGNTVYLWDSSNGGPTTELVAMDEEIGPVTSIRWAPDGRHLAVGLNNSPVQLWDSLAGCKLRTFADGHRSRVGSLDWNNHILTTGGRDSLIINNDVRIQSPIITTYRAHTLEICGLKWSSNGQQLASGGNDNLIYIWSISNTSSGNQHQWLHRLDHHTAAVKALSWCPFQSNLLASGGGIGDQNFGTQTLALA